METNYHDLPARKFPIFIQIGTLLFSIAAILWGVAADCAVAFPGPSGEWGAMGIVLAYVVDIPVGTISLVVALAVKDGNRRLRRLCIIAAVITLCLPLIGDGIHRYRTRWKYGFACAHSSVSVVAGGQAYVQTVLGVSS